jgi:hypothetical protein
MSIKNDYLPLSQDAVQTATPVTIQAWMMRRSAVFCVEDVINHPDKLFYIETS